MMTCHACWTFKTSSFGAQGVLQHHRALVHVKCTLLGTAIFRDVKLFFSSVP